MATSCHPRIASQIFAVLSLVIPSALAAQDVPGLPVVTNFRITVPQPQFRAGRATFGSSVTPGATENPLE